MPKHGQLIFETGKYLAYRSKEAYDLLYAVGVGTAIGIGSNPTIRGSYELWKGTSRKNIKAKRARWDYRSLRRRFKGDVLVEGPDSFEETYRSDIPGYGRPGGSRGDRYSRSKRSNKYITKRHRGRCTCEELLRRVLGKPRQRISRR